MRVNLVNNQAFNLYWPAPRHNKVGKTGLLIRKMAFTSESSEKPEPGVSTSADSENPRYLDNLKKIMENTGRLLRDEDWKIFVRFKATESTPPTQTHITVEGSFLDTLHRLINLEMFVKVQGRLRPQLLSQRNDGTVIWREFESIPIRTKTVGNKKGSFTAEYVEKNELLDWNMPAGDWNNFVGEMTIDIFVDAKDIKVFSLDFDSKAIMKQLMNTSFSPDFFLVSGNMKEISVHKSILKAQSEVFEAMFNSGMGESANCKVNLKRDGGLGRQEGIPISDEGTRAFREFLYCQEYDEAEKSSNTALELLELGHQYEISSLELSMKSIFMGKNLDWFDVDVALQLFLICGLRQEGNGEIKSKMIKVMKSKLEDLRKSQLYNEIYPDEGGTARAMFEWMLTS